MDASQKNPGRAKLKGLKGSKGRPPLDMIRKRTMLRMNEGPAAGLVAELRAIQSDVTGGEADARRWRGVTGDDERKLSEMAIDALKARDLPHLFFECLCGSAFTEIDKPAPLPPPDQKACTRTPSARATELRDGSGGRRSGARFTTGAVESPPAFLHFRSDFHARRASRRLSLLTPCAAPARARAPRPRAGALRRLDRSDAVLHHPRPSPRALGAQSASRPFKQLYDRLSGKKIYPSSKVGPPGLHTLNSPFDDSYSSL